MPDLTQKQRFLSFRSMLGEDVLVIERLRGEEALGRLYDYKVLALAQKDTFDLDSLVGTPASVTMETAARSGGKHRHFHGVVSQVNHIGYDPHGRGRYEITLVPWLWLLTRTSDCRIFQNLTVPEIIKKVFSDLSGATYRLDLRGSYPAREYCVQYRETDFNFVQRLMEHEGIYYFWEHTEGGHTMVLCDKMASHKAVPGFAEIRYRALASGIQEEFQIFDWQIRRTVTPGAFALNSFDFKTPKPSSNTRLLSRSDLKHKHAQGSYEVYDNPGDFVNRADGERLAAIRREEIQCQSHTVTCQTNARGLFCGSKFKAKEVPRKDQNREHLITAAVFTASSGNFGSGTGTGADTYEATLFGIPSNGVFRAARAALPQRVEGPQTAIVCGPAGEEIYVDKYGRVKVQFLWDREGRFDAGSSCWVRVSQAWAGIGFGGMAIPRIGQEVIVDFLEGDPDRPIITGRVYNGSNMPHSSNAGRDGKPGNTPPADLTQAAMMTSFKSNSLGGSGGYNEITMNDKGGAETLFFKAQKDEIHKVGNNREDQVGNNEKRKVGVNRTRDVGNNETVTVGTNRSMTVGANHSETIGANQFITVGSNKAETVAIASAETVGAVKALSVGAGFQTTVGASMNTSVALTQTEQVGLMKHTIVGKRYVIQVGAASITLESSGKISIKGSQIDISASGPVKINGSVVDIN